MRNLKLLKETKHDLPFTNSVDMSIDDVSGDVIVTDGKKVFVLDSHGTLKGPFTMFDTVNYVDVVSSPNICCTGNNNMTIWNSVNDESTDFIELDQTILAVKWSPDCSIGAVVTSDKKLTLINSCLEYLSDLNLDQEGFGDAEFVTIGWGKKETQFHGSEGKEAAKKKTETSGSVSAWDEGGVEIVWREDGEFLAVSWISESGRRLRIFSRTGQLHSTGELIPNMETGLDWRPKVSLITASQRHPRGLDVIFFESNGLRHGEFQLFPSSPLPSPPPRGGGLRWASEVRVRHIRFNREGDVLAVSIEGIGEAKATLGFVRLFTTSNYEWYAKQDISLRSNCLLWCPIDPYRLHVVTDEASYLSFQWTHDTDRSRAVQQRDDPALVAVIDGHAVKFTPFRQMIIPPPMFAYALKFPYSVNFVLLPGPYLKQSESVVNTTSCLIIQSNGDVYVMSLVGQQPIGASGDGCYPITDGVTLEIGAAGGNGYTMKCPLPSVEKLDLTLTGRVRCGVWFSSDTAVLVINNTVSIVTKATPTNTWMHCDLFSLKEEILQLTIGPNTDIYLENALGDVFSWSVDKCFQTIFSSNNPSLIPELVLLFRFPQPCGELLVLSLDIPESLQKSGTSSQLVLGLSHDSHRLFVGPRVLMSLCSSMDLHTDFFLATSMLQTLKCVPLAVSTLQEFHDFFSKEGSTQEGVEGLQDPSSNSQKPSYDEKVRCVEPGTRLVTCVAKDTKVILQMPRGNLETIHPRSLVLCHLRELIDKLQYGEAFSFMKRHRVNLNLLYDHSPTHFLINLRTFVESVDNPSHLNLFLADLVPEDLTLTMYSRFYRRSQDALCGAELDDDLEENQRKKTDRVAEAMIAILDTMDSKKYHLCILTCYAKKTKPELDKALLRMRKLKDAGDPTAWDQGLAHLQYLCDVVSLYHIALGTYDLPLAAAVAQCTQLDPKEYMPFLNELRELPSEHYRRYRIDLFNKQYTRALHNILQAGESYFSECMTLVKDHKLYNEALQFYPTDSSQYKELCLAFAHHLITVEKSVHSAGLVYLRCGALSEAADCFLRSNNWREWICLVQSQNVMDEDKRDKQATELATRLMDLNRHTEALVLLEEHMKDYDESIRCAVAGSLWSDAIRLVSLHTRSDLTTSLLGPELKKATSNLQDRINQQRSQFLNHRRRLVQLRDEHQRKFIEMQNADHWETGEDSENVDLYSDVSSVSGSSQYSNTSRSSQRSSSSKMSGRTSKTKRKAERKKWNLKEGSQFEEVALMEELYKLIQSGQQMAGECELLLDANCHLLTSITSSPDDSRDLQSTASHLMTSMNLLLRLHSNSVKVIWDSHVLTSTGGGSRQAANSDQVFGPLSTANSMANNVQMQAGRKVYDIHEEFLYFAPNILKTVIKNPLL